MRTVDADSLIGLSTHDLTRRSTTPMLASSPIVPFQLTTSQGGRQPAWNASKPDRILSTHDLTRRSTTIPMTSSYLVKTFNSRPHKEVDGIQPCFHKHHYAFQLTTSQGGRPDPEAVRAEIAGLSTHDLTRRSTQLDILIVRPRIFQLTTSQGGRPIYPLKGDDNMAFQLTTSQGGRPQSSGEHTRSGHFQLTTSQGGRLQIRLSLLRLPSFNSRPHKEVDSKYPQLSRIFASIILYFFTNQSFLHDSIFKFRIT